MSNKNKQIFNGVKWSLILHGIAALSGVAGFLALIVWYVVLFREGVSFFSAEHVYNDAVVFLLLSIAFGIGALIHQNKERK